MSDDQEYVEEIRIVRRKKDTIRSRSSKSDEFESDLLRDKNTKNVAGPTESRPVDEEALRRKYQEELRREQEDDLSFDMSGAEPEPAQDRDPSPGEQALANAINELIQEFAGPLLREFALPAAKAKLSELAERRRAKAAERAQAKTEKLRRKIVVLESADEAEPESTATNLAAREPVIPMSRSDFKLAQLQLKMAEDHATQMRWLLAHAEVKHENLSPQLERSVSLMLEGRASELDEEQREAVAFFIRDSTPSLQPERATDRARDQ